MNNIIEISYFIAAILFIIGLRRMSSPVSARGGTQIAGRSHPTEMGAVSRGAT